MTRTYAVLAVTAPTFREIQQKLEAAGYQHCFDEDDGQIVIDMHGIALKDEAGDEGPASDLPTFRRRSDS